MKKKTVKATGVTLASLMLAGMAFLAGCGGSSNQTSDAQAQSGNSSQQAANPNMTVSEPDLANVPIYPGAEKQTMMSGGPGAGGMTTPPSGGSGGAGGMGSGGTPPPLSMVRYQTSDSTDQVVAWYRQQLSGKDGFAETTGSIGPQGSSEAQTIFTFKNGDMIHTIMVGSASRNQGITEIIISEGAPPAPMSGQSR